MAEFCSECGIKLVEGKPFCAECGARVEDAASGSSGTPDDRVVVAGSVENSPMTSIVSPSESQSSLSDAAPKIRRYLSLGAVAVAFVVGGMLLAQSLWLSPEARLSGYVWEVREATANGVLESLPSDWTQWAFLPDGQMYILSHASAQDGGRRRYTYREYFVPSEEDEYRWSVENGYLVVSNSQRRSQRRLKFEGSDTMALTAEGFSYEDGERIPLPEEDRHEVWVRVSEAE